MSPRTFLLFSSLLATGARVHPQEGAAPDAHALFAANCASCHGETGAGDGWTPLIRPARSFQDGGFSYGNTPEALVRTISNGIPGTEMPGFDTSLSPAELRVLADHVITLGPDVREVTESETVMRVLDRPLVVRGMLPPIADGALEHPRGLLLGTTAGFTFEYRADDVRLLGVRQGGFARRTDWTGRGGTPLEPLGQVVHLVAGGLPPATFQHRHGGELVARLVSTWIDGEAMGLRYRIDSPEGRRLAQVSERVEALPTKLGVAFRRTFQVRGVADDVLLAIRAASLGDDPVVGRVGFPAGAAERPGALLLWQVVQRGDASFECIGVSGAPVATSRGRIDLWLDQISERLQEVVLVTIPVTGWDDELAPCLQEVRAR